MLHGVNVCVRAGNRSLQEPLDSEIPPVAEPTLVVPRRVALKMVLVVIGHVTPRISLER